MKNKKRYAGKRSSGQEVTAMTSAPPLTVPLPSEETVKLCQNSTLSLYHEKLAKSRRLFQKRNFFLPFFAPRAGARPHPHPHVSKLGGSPTDWTQFNFTQIF